jgi:endonuclease/exonuclease/phosphatase family metal-dependent hydrolase
MNFWKKSVLFFCFLLLLISLVPSVQANAAPVAQDTISNPLRILSWNIFMLPRFVHLTGKRTRAFHIAQELKASDYQVLVFQEAFLSDARHIIRKLLDGVFPYEYGPANSKGGIKTSSGIWVLSKIPLQMLEEIKFCKCYGFADCFARKGAMLLQGEFEGQTFQVLGTHLQAAGPHTTRQAQFQEMRTMLDRHQQPGVPQIVCGDMNTAKNQDESYQDMLASLDVEDGPLDIQLEGARDIYPNDLRDWGNDRFEVIDYVFYRQNSKPAKKMTRVLKCISKPWCKRHKDLSDHFAMDFSIWW